MNTFLTLGIMVGIAFSCEAQNIVSKQTLVPPPTPYTITVQDANSRAWQQTTYDVSPTGGVVTNTHGYTELCSGLNHLVNGEWVESNEHIDILPNGTALATNGQHQAYFPGDIYQGQIELVTPDGQLLQSRPLALAYFDGTNTVVIAELTNSIGFVVGNNQVVYPNAFTGFKVDLRYTYTKAGFEQDIVLRQQPPTPESLGLNPDSARLQIMTEFFSAPRPAIASTALPTQAGVSLDDESLDFGTMQMVPGRAFLMGQNAQNAGAMVSKHWLMVSGRQVLIEEVPVNAILEGLAALPLMAMNSGSGKSLHTASKHLQLPPQHLAQKTSKTMLLAKAEASMQGFVMDYNTVTGSFTNYTFRGDTTYYISGPFTLKGTNTFEGGTVIKYATNATLSFAFSVGGVLGTVYWQADAYRPAIFTASDDNSVGETISGSTGNPTNYYATTALNFTYLGSSKSAVIIPGLSHFRIAFAQTAINTADTNLSVSDSQILNCGTGINMTSPSSNFNETNYLKNLLFANVGTALGIGDYLNQPYYNLFFSVQNVTFRGIGCIGSLSFDGNNQNNCFINFTNCILASVTNLCVTNYYFGASMGVPNFNGANNGFYISPVCGANQVTNAFYPFQTVGTGSCYLTNGCSFFNAGTTSIDSALLADLRIKTTWPPILYSNVSISINTTLNPQAQRDTDTPDLGYHYDPVDYLVDQFVVTNAALTLANGVAIATCNDSGLLIEDGSSITSIGSPSYPNWFVRYSSVQEQPISLNGLGLGPSSGLDVNPYHVSLAPTGQFRFTKFACPAGGGQHLYHLQPNWSYGNLLVQDCEFWSGTNNFGGNTNSVATLRNNLFARSTFSAVPYNSTATSYLYLTNNLFWGVSSVLFNSILRAAASTNYCVFNNDFDSCSNIGSTTVSITNGYNAYFNSTGYVYPTNATDIFSTNTLAFQTGPLGTFYQPTTSPLINMGSTNANLLGLYQYTVTSNLISGVEIKETNSIVDIGYHYVATDAYGNPVDTNGDGIPDYLEDANGNGIFDMSDLGDWKISPFGLSGLNQLQVFTPLK